MKLYSNILRSYFQLQLNVHYENYFSSLTSSMELLLYGKKGVVICRKYWLIGFHIIGTVNAKSFLSMRLRKFKSFLSIAFENIHFKREGNTVKSDNKKA